MRKMNALGTQVSQVALRHKARDHHRHGSIGTSPHATDHPTKISSVNGRTGALGAQMSTGRSAGSDEHMTAIAIAATSAKPGPPLPRDQDRADRASPR